MIGSDLLVPWKQLVRMARLEVDMIFSRAAKFLIRPGFFSGSGWTGAAALMTGATAPQLGWGVKPLPLADRGLARSFAWRASPLKARLEAHQGPRGGDTYHTHTWNIQGATKTPWRSPVRSRSYGTPIRR
jgi:hypothetical protein